MARRPFVRTSIRSTLPALLAALAAAACDCGGEPPLQIISEDFRVVSGVPRDDVTPPSLARDPPVPDPSKFGVNVPIQCDSYEQQTLRKVDILWVVDTSASMEQEQQKLAANFASFVTYLTSAQPPINFHLGVITTDTEQEDEAAGIGPGWLRRVTGAAQPYISCDGAGNCNVGSPQDAVNAFQQVVQVGTDGSPVEKGLLAVMLALTEPVKTEHNGGFLRDDASLYVIVVSDEEDSSCLPFVNPAVTPTDCVAGPNCKCEDSPSWGSVQYFTRFMEGLKGFGNSNAAAVAAIVATEQDTLPYDDGTGRTYVGCTSNRTDACANPQDPGAGTAECAFHAARYVQVAQATGGIATSICDEDFSAALSSLGFAVSGLKTEFKLSRAPYLDSLEVALFPPGATPCDAATPCAAPGTCVRGRCGEVVAEDRTAGYQYQRCGDGVPKNAVRLNGGSVPDPLDTIEICYQVDVGTDLTQCP